jgi:hypothetical protein
MKLTPAICICCLLFFAAAGAQGPCLQQTDLWTLPYEDVSDLLRRYPGMYPLDYGTLGAPVNFRPWNLHPWEMRVERDGIPQNRRFDGIYEPNLQPGNEIETIRYDFLAGGSTGKILMDTRALNVDTPYTEFQIREGYYGYGTVDFAHGQRLYNSLTLEMTGRLGWYDGRRISSASRATQLRGRVGMDVGSRWRANLTYAGSNVKSDFLLSEHDYIPSREEGILTIAEKESLQTAWNPSLKIYSREERETWGSPWHARDFIAGAIAEVHPRIAGQYFTIRQADSWTEINFPGMNRRNELSVGVSVNDSLDFRVFSLSLRSGIHRESGWAGNRERDQRWLSDLSARIETKPLWNMRARAGTSFSESTVPISWWRGSYSLANRPQVFAPEFAELTRQYVGVAEGNSPVDRYLSSEIGVRWTRGRAFCDAAFMTITRPGDFASHFSITDNTVQLVYARDSSESVEVGLAGGAIIPLWYGLGIESWWFRQANSEDFGTSSDVLGWNRLYFERSFFKSPLTIRSHISYEYIGRRLTFSDLVPTPVAIGPSYLFGFRLSATIRGVTVIWGTENVLKEHYAYMPGYRMIAKEEYLAFIWRLWL